jgi:hypothetical protein
MVDGIHEDLNRILKKPPTDPVENENRPIEDVASGGICFNSIEFGYSLFFYVQKTPGTSFW